MKPGSTACVLAAVSLFLPGCFFSQSSTWTGEKSADMKVAGAAADVLTAPLQIPLMLEQQRTNRPPYDREAVLLKEKQQRPEKEASMAIAKRILADLEKNPSALNDDRFWDNQPTNDPTAMLGLQWRLQQTSAPASPAVNAYLLKRFPQYSEGILRPWRTTHMELAALLTDKSQRYEIRTSALDTLVRDPTFDFNAEFRKLLLKEFTLKATLLFGRPSFTRPELAEIITDPNTEKWIREMAAQDLSRGLFKP